MPWGELATMMMKTVLMIGFMSVLIPFRLSAKKNLFILSCLGLLLCVAEGFVAYNKTSISESYGFLLLSIPLFVVFRLLSAAKGIRFLFIMFTAVLFYHMLSTLLTAFRIHTGGSFTFPYILLSLLAFGILLAGALGLQKDFHKIVFIYRYEFICLTPILALLLGISILFSPISEQQSLLDLDLLFITLGIDLLTVMLYLYIAVSFHSLSKLTNATREATALHMKMQQTKDRIELLQSSQEKTLLYHHNLLCHISRIRELLDSGETTQLRDYLNAIQEKVSSDIPEHYCQNETVNFLLASYITRAWDAGVRLTLDTEVPHSLPMTTPEFCALISNALEDAIETTAKVNHGMEKMVQLMVWLSDGKLLIQVENPYMEKIRMENGLPKKESPDDGLGMAGIVNIVKKYNGCSSFTAEGGRFTLRIII